MTKRIIGLLLVVFLLIGFCSCGKQVSEYAKEHGQISLEIIEDYLNGNISNDIARSKLKTQESLIRENCEKIETETGKHPTFDSIVATEIGICWTAIFSHDIGSGSKESIKKAAKELEKAMNK